ncbi:small integral membrane protein 35 [Catharus ustulatus]|uniref:small integral membrane protein 35 n=1 Tax=Catharus ustulatus TaxID=91951 RepID=UPI001C5BE7EF|nr:small integral membrane protein 35 [Catharus ustulatus]
MESQTVLAESRQSWQSPPWGQHTQESYTPDPSCPVPGRRQSGPPACVCLQSPSSLCFPGQEPIKVIGVVLGIGLALLILASFGYTFIRWYRRGYSRRRPDFVFNFYHSRGLGSVALELVPPFSISGSLGTSGSGYEPFHSQGP